VVWGVVQGVIGVIAAQWLRMPPEAYQGSDATPAAAIAAHQTMRSYSPREMLQSPVFYLLFLMMSMMSTSGLMVVSNVGPFAKEFGVADMLVLGMAALPLSLTLSRVTNGLTRPFFGWISDHIGREPTMALAFSLEAIAILVRCHELRLPLYRAGRRLDPRRTGGDLSQADDGKLDGRVHRCRRARRADGAAGYRGAAIHAARPHRQHPGDPPFRFDTAPDSP